VTARGKFITFEGIDGAGKSTHLNWFRARLEAKLGPAQVALVTTREPGGTALGEALRDVLLHQPMQLETEALLMFAARYEHLAAVIQPALKRGDWVLSDRFSDASFAYQGGGRGLALSRLNTLEAWVQGDFQPDLTVLFDLCPKLANERRGLPRAPDKFERESEAFFARVRAEYLRRAAEAPDRFVLIDAAKSIAEIQQKLDKVIVSL